MSGFLALTRALMIRMLLLIAKCNPKDRQWQAHHLGISNIPCGGGYLGEANNHATGDVD